MIVVEAAVLSRFVDLLRKKAIERANRSQENDSKKCFFQAGQAESFGWASDHLKTIIEQEGYEAGERSR